MGRDESNTSSKAGSSSAVL